MVKSELFNKYGISHGFCGIELSNTKGETVYEKLENIINVPILRLDQVHSSEVLNIDSPTEFLHHNSTHPKGDGFILTQPGYSLAIRTADCLPILISNKSRQFVAALHSGWRGSLSGINQNVIAKLQQMNCNLDELIIAIGPSISQESYEVSIDFVDNFITKDKSSKNFFKTTHGNKYLFDNKGYVHSIYKALGVKEIDVIDIDTYTSDEFYSYRASTHGKSQKNGSNIGFINFAQ